jgi:sulfotransferase family protein
MSERDRLKHALTLDPLIETALKESQTGAREFRDTSFLPNLRKALEIPTRLDLSERGLMGVHANFVRFLVNRLRYEADLARHPEILDEDVSDPIVVLGLPRSGTTKLQRFLSADPHVQTTHTYRMFNPAPFPGEQPGEPRPRLEWTERMMSVVSNTAETYWVMHDFHSMEADESSFVPLANFDYVMQFITTPDKPYLDWVRSVSRVPPLTYLKRMLQYLQWQDGGRRDRPWLLKNPGHTGEIQEMFEVFPKATFVISQRDLATTMASSMRMMGEIYSQSFDNPDSRRTGNDTVDYWSYELNRYQQQRQSLGARVRIVEAPYRQCVDDALSIAREVYALHGMPWTRVGEEAMLAWERKNPRHKKGSYDYSLEKYGWNPERVEQAFGPIAKRWRGF